MAQTGNGTSGYVRATAAIAAGTVATPSFHFWYRNASVPGTAVIDQPFSLADSGGAYYLVFSWDHTAAAAAQAVTGRASGGAYSDAKLSTSLTANTWHAIGGQYDGVNVRAWLNGVNETSTACSAFTAGTNPTPSVLSGLAGTSNFDDGTIAEVAIWSSVLVAADYLQLAKGVCPLFVKPASLIAYWPLIRDVVPVKGGAIASTGLTVANHPPVRYMADPWPVELFLPTISMSISHTLTLSGSPSRGTVLDSLSQSLRFQSRFRSDSGMLASGRIKPRVDVR